MCGTSRDAAAAPVCGIPGNAAAAAPADGIPGNAAAAPAVAAAVAPAPRTPSPTPPDLPTPTPPDPARPPGAAVVPATPTQKRRRRRTGASAAEAIDVDADAAGRQHAEEQQCVVAFLVDELEQRETRIQQLEKDLAASRAGGARGPVSLELDDAIGQEDDDADRRRLEKRRSQVVRFFVSVEVELQELSGFDFRRGGRTPGAKASLGRLAGRCDAALLNALWRDVETLRKLRNEAAHRDPLPLLGATSDDELKSLIQRVKAEPRARSSRGGAIALSMSGKTGVTAWLSFKFKCVCLSPP